MRAAGHGYRVNLLQLVKDGARSVENVRKEKHPLEDGHGARKGTGY